MNKRKDHSGVLQLFPKLRINTACPKNIDTDVIRPFPLKAHSLQFVPPKLITMHCNTTLRLQHVPVNISVSIAVKMDAQ